MKRSAAPSSSSSSLALKVDCSVNPLDFDFHPSKPTLLAAALLNGTVECHDIQELLTEKQQETQQGKEQQEEDELDSILSSTVVHRPPPLATNKETSIAAAKLPSTSDNNDGLKPPPKQQYSSRCISFSKDGNWLYSGGSTGELVGLDAQRICTFTNPATNDTGNADEVVVQWRIPQASYQQSPLQVIKQLSHPNLLATGDEAGGVRIWDTRLMSSSSTTIKSPLPMGCIFSWKKHDDYISGLEVSNDGHTLLASSADCTISVYDIRQGGKKQADQRFLRQSDDQEDELLSIQIIKNGRKVVCGTGQGVLAVFSFGTWGDVSDRFPGHPASVDALLKLDEDTLLTGASDGLIRVVSIHPDRLLGVLGDHDGFPVEKLGMNADRSFVGSVTHDTMIRLWNTSILFDDDHEADDDDEDKEQVMTSNASGSQDGTGAADRAARDSDDEWEDMDEGAGEDDDNDEASDIDSGGESDSDEEEEEETANSKRSKRFKTANEKFFEDL